MYPEDDLFELFKKGVIDPQGSWSGRYRMPYRQKINTIVHIERK